MAFQLQERNYKLLSRWNTCPTTIHHVFTGYRSLLEVPVAKAHAPSYVVGMPINTTTLHTGLLGVQRYGFQTLEGSPELSLLSLIPGPLKNIKRSILGHCLVVIRTIIAQHWKSTLTHHLLTGFRPWMTWWVWSTRRRGRVTGWPHLMQRGLVEKYIGPPTLYCLYCQPLELPSLDTPRFPNSTLHPNGTPPACIIFWHYFPPPLFLYSPPLLLPLYFSSCFMCFVNLCWLPLLFI